MEIIKPGREVPKFFIASCQKLGNRGCGAELKVTPEDCFQCPYATSWHDDTPIGGGRWLSFYCEQCGLLLTPDYDYADKNQWKGIEDKAIKMGLCFKTDENVPPWSHVNFPTMKDFNEKHDIKFGIR